MNEQFEFKKVLSLSRRFGYSVLALIPIVYLIFFVFRYKIDAPTWNEWQFFLPWLEKYYQGTLSLNDMWTQMHGQRHFFTRIIWVILARLTGRDISYSMAAKILVVMGTFVVISYQIKRTAKAINDQGIKWIIPIISLILFSLSQYGNWHEVGGISYFLTIFSVVLGTVLLANPEFRWSYFRSAVLLGIFATLSNSIGICYWFSGLFVLFFVSPRDSRIRKLSIILWLVCGFITIYLYTCGLWHPSPGVIFVQPFEYIKYAVKILGIPVMFFYKGYRGAMFIAGSLGLIFLCYMCWLSIRYRYIKFQLLLPYISLSLYSIGGAMLVAFGRIAPSLKRYPTSSCSVTNPSLFWISNVVFLYLLITARDPQLKSHKRYRFKKWGWLSILILVVSLTARGGFRASRYVRERYYKLLPAQNELLVMENDALLKRLHPYGLDLIKKNVGILKKYHLSVFRDKED